MAWKQKINAKSEPERMNHVNKRIVTGIVSFLLVAMVGCQQNHNSEQEGRNDNQNPNVHEVKQSVDEPGRNNQKNPSSQDIARSLVKVAEGVKQVNSATAIVTMGYAVVGLDVDKNLDRTGVDNVKYSVAEALRDQRYGANAVVLADPDSVQQLKEMKDNIGQGRPVSGVLDQLADIVGRVMPQIPNDMKNQIKNEKPNQNQRQTPGNQNRNPQNKKQNQQQTNSGNNNQTPHNHPAQKQSKSNK